MGPAANRARKLKQLSRLLAVAALLLPAAFAEKSPPPARAATTYPAVDVHPSENVAVAADPLDSRDKESFFQIDYLKAGYMPVRLIITNNSGATIKLDQVRAYFVTADGDKLQAADTDDVERRTNDVGSDPNKRMERPPLLRGIGKPKNKDPKIQADFRLADFADLAVAPHETQSGYLFFDINGMENPLAGAKLLVRGIEAGDGTQLFYFEAPFDKYLAAKHK
jgi:hypothetical protein